jgi:hypothetical protein
MRSPPRADPKYGHTEVTEYWPNTLWAGAYTGSLEFLDVTRPAHDLPGAHHLIFLNNTSFAQLILEFKESVITFEAPPHQSELVIPPVLLRAQIATRYLKRLERNVVMEQPLTRFVHYAWL